MAKPMMWMGTRYRAGWVPCPAVDADFSEVGWSTKTVYLNGRAYVRRSQSTHKEYNLNWNPDKRDNLRPVTDMYAGLWGGGPIYFIDPMAMDKNLLPQFMASPMMGAYGAPLLYGEVDPILFETGDTVLNYPVESAAYPFNSSPYLRKVYIPIPPGHTAWVGVHRRDMVDNPYGGQFQVVPYLTSINTAPAVQIPFRGIFDEVRVDTPFDGDTYRGIECFIEPDTMYTGAMVQIFKTGVTPPTGGFVSGQGHGGCDFESAPVQQAYSAALDRLGMSARLVEIDSWE